MAFDSGMFPARPRKGGAVYTNYMFYIYERVVEGRLPNFMGARIPVPTNFNPGAWAKLAVKPS